MRHARFILSALLEELKYPTSRTATLRIRAALVCVLVWSQPLFQPTSREARAAEVVLAATAENKLHHIAFSHDGKLLASDGPDNTVLVWDTSTWTQRHTLSGLNGHLRALAFVPGKPVLISASAGEPLNEAIFWHLGGQQPPVRKRLPRDAAIWSMAVSPDGETLALPALSPEPNDEDRRVELLSIDDLKTQRVLRAPDFDCLAFSPDREKLAASSASTGEVVLWRLPHDQPPISLKLPKGASPAVTFSPDSSLLAAANGFKGGNGSVLLWEVASGKELRLLESDAGTIRSLLFTPDGKYLIAGSRRPGSRRFDDEAIVIIWDMKSHRARTRIVPAATNAHQVASSPDGRNLAVAGGDGKIRIWSASDLTGPFTEK